LGTFLLGAQLIDVLSRLARPGDGKAAWDAFVPKYLPRYAGHAETLYRGYRGALSHQYSLNGIRLVDGPDQVHRHWGVEEGERVLHLETFVSDLEQAFGSFYRDLESSDELRKKVLQRVSQFPLLGIVGGLEPIPPASAASSPTRLAGVPTHFGLPISDDAQSATSAEPKMAIPKSRKPKR
jgi:hypothetical protein